jgi:hypothetical protein
MKTTCEKGYLLSQSLDCSSIHKNSHFFGKVVNEKTDYKKLVAL